MLLRLRVALPDRPGSLGYVARALGDAGADIIQVLVLERVGGRAIDDFTVMWPASAPTSRVVSSLIAIPGVRVDGAWRATELPEPGGREVSIIGQVAANPDLGLSTLVDAIPAVLAGDWAMAVAVGADWADDSQRRADGSKRRADGVTVIGVSWRAPSAPPSVEIIPVRSRSLTAADGTHLAIAPFQRGGLVMVVARGGPGGDVAAPPFHRSEVERLAQIVGAAAAVLGEDPVRLVRCSSVAVGSR